MIDDVIGRYCPKVKGPDKKVQYLHAGHRCTRTACFRDLKSKREEVRHVLSIFFCTPELHGYVLAHMLARRMAEGRVERFGFNFMKPLPASFCE